MLRQIFLTLALAAAGLFPALLSAAPGDLSVLSSPTSQPIILGEKHRFHSGLLNEEREYWLRIPPSYAQNKLPLEVTVFYVMDAEKYFPSAAASAVWLEDPRVSGLGPCVVVGVVSGNKLEDFTPTPSNADEEGNVRDDMKPCGGGAEGFYHFLTTELRNDIELNIPQQLTVKRRIIAGEGLGGLFVLHALLHHPESFDGYAVLDPALWWDRGALLRRALKAGARTARDPKPAFYGTFIIDDGSRLERGNESTFRNEAVPLLEKQGIRTEIVNYAGITDESIAPKVLYDALKALYPAENTPVSAP